MRVQHGILFLVVIACLIGSLAYAANADLKIGLLQQIDQKQGQSQVHKIKSGSTHTNGTFFGQRYSLEKIIISHSEKVQPFFERAFKQGLREFIVDINADELFAIAKSEAGKQSWFHNLDRGKTQMRSKQCFRNVSNSITGPAMRADALLNAAVIYVIRAQDIELRDTACHSSLISPTPKRQKIILYYQ